MWASTKTRCSCLRRKRATGSRAGSVLLTPAHPLTEWTELGTGHLGYACPGLPHPARSVPSWIVVSSPITTLAATRRFRKTERTEAQLHHPQARPCLSCADRHSLTSSAAPGALSSSEVTTGTPPVEPGPVCRSVLNAWGCTSRSLEDVHMGSGGHEMAGACNPAPQRG